MNKDPLISVIVPAYNSSKYVKKCIQSVLNQDYNNFELIVVNDGSTDNTLEILNTLSKKDNRIKVLNQKNSGVSSARNLGLSNSSGEYITFLDSDDTLTKTALSDFLSEINENVDLVICSSREVRLKGMDVLYPSKIYDNIYTIKNDFIEFDLYIRKPCANLYRKSIIDNYNVRFPLSMSFGEDHIFNLEYIKHINNSVIISDKIVYNYMIMHNGLCAKYHEDMHSLEKTIYLKIADAFGGLDDIPKKYHNHYVSCYLNGCIEYYISQAPLRQAIKKVEETFDIFSDLLNDDIINRLFNSKQINLIQSKKYDKFVVDFIIKKPKETLYRKVRKNIKSIIKKIS